MFYGLKWKFQKNIIDDCETEPDFAQSEDIGRSMWRRRNFHCFETRMHSFSVSNSIHSRCCSIPMTCILARKYFAVVSKKTKQCSNGIPNYFALFFLFSSADFSAFKHRHLTLDWRIVAHVNRSRFSPLLLFCFAKYFINVVSLLFHPSSFMVSHCQLIFVCFFFYGPNAHTMMSCELSEMPCQRATYSFFVEFCHKILNGKHPFFLECITENPSFRKRNKVSIEQLSSIFNFIWQFSRMRWLSIFLASTHVISIILSSRAHITPITVSFFSWILLIYSRTNAQHEHAIKPFLSHCFLQGFQ